MKSEKMLLQIPFLLLVTVVGVMQTYFLNGFVYPLKHNGWFYENCNIPFDPRAVPEQQIAPSKAFQVPVTTRNNSESESDESTVFSPEKEVLFQRRFEEN